MLEQKSQTTNSDDQKVVHRPLCSRESPISHLQSSSHLRPLTRFHASVSTHGTTHDQPRGDRGGQIAHVANGEQGEGGGAVSSGLVVVAALVWQHMLGSSRVPSSAPVLGPAAAPRRPPGGRWASNVQCRCRVVSSAAWQKEMLIGRLLHPTTQRVPDL